MFEPLTNINSEEIASDCSSADDSSDEDTTELGTLTDMQTISTFVFTLLAVELDYRFTRFNISMTGASVGNVFQ